MTSISDTTSTTSTTATSTTSTSLNDLDMDTFLQLMITELQNQDPLEPLDNAELLSQISQIREVASTDNLTKTLNSVLLGQNITSATNLIGADIEAVSDDGEIVSGIVQRVSIEDGDPRLYLTLDTKANGSTLAGNVEPGTYSYRVVWNNANGELEGIELSGDDAVTITDDGYTQSIKLTNLPVTGENKWIYRTDNTGEGNYQLVGTLTDGSQGSFVDGLSDAERNQTRLTQSFDDVTGIRSYEVSLSNIAQVRQASSSD